MSRKSRHSHAAPETPMKPPAGAAAAAGPDVSQLSAENLPTGSFPAPRGNAFRVFFDPQVYAATLAHAAEDVSFEICGVLVGDLCRDADGPFVNVRNYIRCDSAEKKFAEVTFTHESWSQINREMDTKFQDQRIVGWYHSHPNFGIFLSDRDFFIQQNFFSGPGQIALVIDPVRKIEGVFEWHSGATAPTPHYWVGPRMLLAPGGASATEMPEAEGMNPSPAAFAPMPMDSYGMTTTLLAALCLFLLGWMLSGWSAGTERRRIIEGMVAHFGIWQVLRPGLEDGLAKANSELKHAANQMRRLSDDHLKRSAEVLAAEKDEARRAELQKVGDKLNDDWRKTRHAIAETILMLDHMKQLYGFTPEERDAVVRYLTQKQIDLQAAESVAKEKPRAKSDEAPPAPNGRPPAGANAPKNPPKAEPTPANP